MKFGYVTVNGVNSNDIRENNQSKYIMEAGVHAYRTEI